MSCVRHGGTGTFHRRRGVVGRDKDRFMYEDYELPIAVKISKIYISVLDRKPVHVGGWWVD